MAFVSTFWSVHNTETKRDITLIPDAFFDVILAKDKEGIVEIWLVGLGTAFEEHKQMEPKTLFGVSFTLLAAEYIFNRSIAELKNEATQLPTDLWGITAADFSDLNQLQAKITCEIIKRMPQVIDPRKKKLFDLLYESKGELTVGELSEKSGWASRQINRYFNAQFGLSLKTYCTILRLSHSFEQLKKGDFFPLLNFSDQPHFIREVKRFTGVSPKELFKNKNDRFIQLSALAKK